MAMVITYDSWGSASPDVPISLPMPTPTPKSHTARNRKTMHEAQEDPAEDLLCIRVLLVLLTAIV